MGGCPMASSHLQYSTVKYSTSNTLFHSDLFHRTVQYSTVQHVLYSMYCTVLNLCLHCFPVQYSAVCIGVTLSAR